jgi:hypothetical protein
MQTMALSATMSSSTVSSLREKCSKIFDNSKSLEEFTTNIDKLIAEDELAQKYPSMKNVVVPLHKVISMSKSIRSERKKLNSAIEALTKANKLKKRGRKRWVQCQRCGKDGKIGKKRCGSCKGKGRKRVQEKDRPASTRSSVSAERDANKFYKEYSKNYSDCKSLLSKLIQNAIEEKDLDQKAIDALSKSYPTQKNKAQAYQKKCAMYVKQIHDTIDYHKNQK